MFRRIIFPAVLEANQRVLPEWHQVRQQETVGRFDFVFRILRRLRIARSHRVACEGQGHIVAAPVIAATSPFLGAGALRLRCLAVIKEEARIAFQCAETRAVGENERRADELARPVAAALSLARVEQNEILAADWLRMIAVSRVEVANVSRRIVKWFVTRAPAQIGEIVRGIAEKLDLRGAEERHREIAGQRHALRIEANVDGEGFDEVFAIVAVVERARAEEEGQRRVDGRLRQIIPCDTQPGAAQGNGLIPRRGKLQRAQHGWRWWGDFLQKQCRVFAEGQRFAADLHQAGRARLRSQIGARTVDQDRGALPCPAASGHPTL